MTGGVSHVDSFDPKPKLFADAGKTVHGRQLAGQARRLHAVSQAARTGSSGPAASAAPRSATCSRTCGRCVDDLCVIRSMASDHTNHYEATLGMHTGSFTFARPSIGAWVSYGLGTENRNLPSFVAIAPHVPYAGHPDLGLATSCPAATRARTSSPARRRSPTSHRRAGSAALQQLELERVAPTPIAGTSSARRPTRRSRPGSSRSRRPSACSARRPRSSTSPAKPTRRSRSTAWSAAAPTASPGNAWSPGGWPSAACGSSS